MTLTLKAPGTSNRWRLIYLDHKAGINLKGAAVEHEAPAIPGGWQGHFGRTEGGHHSSPGWESVRLPDPVLPAAWGDLVTERREVEAQMRVISDLPCS